MRQSTRHFTVRTADDGRKKDRRCLKVQNLRSFHIFIFTGRGTCEQACCLIIFIPPRSSAGSALPWQAFTKEIIQRIVRCRLSGSGILRSRTLFRIHHSFHEFIKRTLKKRENFCRVFCEGLRVYIFHQKSYHNTTAGDKHFGFQSHRDRIFCFLSYSIIRRLLLLSAASSAFGSFSCCCYSVPFFNHSFYLFSI